MTTDVETLAEAMAHWMRDDPDVPRDAEQDAMQMEVYRLQATEYIKHLPRPICTDANHDGLRTAIRIQTDKVIDRDAQLAMLREALLAERGWKHDNEHDGWPDDCTIEPCATTNRALRDTAQPAQDAIERIEKPWRDALLGTSGRLRTLGEPCWCSWPINDSQPDHEPFCAAARALLDGRDK
jgi:hypothetical protein